MHPLPGYPEGQFREVEVEIHAGRRAGRDLLRTAKRRLVAAGCRAEPPMPKLVRALGQRASGPPEVVIPRLRPDATVSAVIRHATSRTVTQIMRHDPGVRLGADPEDVHQFRVATRRLRSDLRTFAKFLDPGPVSELRNGLRLLGRRAGAARDSDVLAGRLRTKADQLPAQDAAGAEELVRRLDGQARAARAALLDALRVPAYDQLLDALVSMARQPPIAAESAGLAGRPAAGMAPSLMRPPWRRLKHAANALGNHSPDTKWHAVRIRAKRCRYTAEALAPICGHRAKRFAAALAAVQDLLGEHQDSVVAEAWLRDAAATVPTACVTAGELIAAERRERSRLRSRWPAVWQRASGKKLRRWF